jgi:hypothetical protein
VDTQDGLIALGVLGSFALVSCWVALCEKLAPAIGWEPHDDRC